MFFKKYSANLGGGVSDHIFLKIFYPSLNFISLLNESCINNRKFHVWGRGGVLNVGDGGLGCIQRAVNAEKWEAAAEGLDCTGARAQVHWHWRTRVYSACMVKSQFKLAGWR